ncbi:alpha/beta-hydrolase [Sodiomyces alkalinus F11]|uniref:Alpha/beta-hydrolase n=1 Tax=Sodiomyces alkalinus (strain CBS 110278 / VKM F-3762 / F11) TaxID=1314773 RepID=A0A3N2Q7C1_SODAK|nr:alpha/beta-hydrolase [Sodiomyces alkalinus F11]ROT42650.1 alpha/beta-hydrolase [Sodiomyces alkalinus F11]
MASNSDSSLLTLPDGRSLEYRLSAPPSGPVILLPNFLGAPFQAWDPFLPSLHARNFRTLNFNQPGHGASTTPADLTSTTFPSIADDVSHLLSHLGIETLYAWIGLSMGAALSFFFVTRHPDRVGKLIACDTLSSSPRNAGTDDIFANRVKAARDAGSLSATVESTLQRWFGDAWIAAHPDETARLRALMATTTLDGFETCCNALRSDTFDVRPLFRKVGASVEEALLVVGENDGDLPQSMATMRDEVQEGFKEAGKDREVELKLIRNAGHVSFIDGFEQFSNHVLAFL